jgi:alcohol dehydrogenase (cytochrome c)
MVGNKFLLAVLISMSSLSNASLKNEGNGIDVVKALQQCKKIENKTEHLTYKKGAAYLGQGFRIHKQFDDHIGSLRAMNPVTGETVWEHHEKLPLWAGTLTTKGNLVITGTSDGFVKAFDAKNGKELWSFQTGSGIVSVPVTWEMDGKQYLGIGSGYGGAVPLWGGDVADLTKPVSQGGSYWVFEIPDAKAVAAK